MIMNTTSTSSVGHEHSTAYSLMKRGKRGAAAFIAADCCIVAAAAATDATDQQAPQDTDEAETALIRCKVLDNLLDVLLNPYDAIGEWNNLDWLRWLMAGGKTLDEFSSAVKGYDYGTCCGLVWTANYVAYRCRTCSISPCMSLCGDCFKRGDHTGHDFNMFRSQAGGACDCGDTSVMKPEGFCRKHSSTNNLDGSTSGCKQPPADLLRVAERIMPRLMLRLVQYLRENSKIADSRTPSSPHIPLSVGGIGSQQQQNLLLGVDLDPFLAMLHDLSALGAAMRRVMTVSLTSEKIYRWACDYYTSSTGSIVNQEPCLQEQQQTIYSIYTNKVRRYYTEAINQYNTPSTSSNNRRRRDSNTTDAISGDITMGHSGSPSNSEEDDDDDDLGQDDQNSSKLNHSSFLQEIVFWTVRYEFPQKMVCLLLNLLPDATYKEALTEAFVMHYGCVARVLATTRDSDTLSNHIVHISVQLFSNEALATRMVDKLGLLRVMVSSLRRMMIKILIPSTLYDATQNKHKVVDCSKAVMKDHCYWPLVSDLNNVLSHRPIAIKFMCDERLLDSWFSYLSMFQGMNVNCRELRNHVEFEPNTYYAAFSAELEASAYPMWAMLSHLTSAETWPLASSVIHSCLKRLRKWLKDVGYFNNQCVSDVSTASSLANYNIGTHSTTAIIRRSDDLNQFTFHLPLHRYLAVFVCQAVRAQGARIEDIIPYSTCDTADRDALLLAIAVHPVRAQAAFYEIMQGAWIRNGLQIKGQAMTYIQSNFCISMVDADIYLLQLCLSELSDVNIFMSLILEKFKVYDWLHVIKHGGLPQIMDTMEYDTSGMEGLLVFLATLVGIRTNLCCDEDYDYCQSQLEMVTLLCVSDKTHSQLMELMPERCGGGTQTTIVTPTTTIRERDNDLDQGPKDFETVLQTVAEYKRPQFEASGIMQQGLYVPLPHVWRNLYDPVHILLRAVHRRDFQSALDRYTSYMRSIGLLKQNEIPWPPYKKPQQHHPAYRDPCRALLSRLFHAVAWHCLYRSAVFRDIGEHTLSLLIYLLDLAWTCYIDSSKTLSNQQQPPMDIDTPTAPLATSSKKYPHEPPKTDTDEKLCPTRQIKITEADASHACCESDKIKDTGKKQDTKPLLLDRWFSSDDLVHNLCTTITNFDLPPPYFHYFFGPGSENTIPPSNASAASTIATNIFGVLTSPSFSVSHNFGNTVNPIKRRLLRGLPANNENDNSTETSVESGEQNKCIEDNENQLAAETNDDDKQNSLIPINESIISLLLKLHSQLTGKSDSYHPPLPSSSVTDEPIPANKLFPEANDHIRCGDGAFYVGRLLDRLAKGSSSCYDCIIHHRLLLWPKAVVMQETATREDEEREQQERKRRARDRKQQMMEEIEKEQRRFLDSLRFSEDVNYIDTELPGQSPSTGSTIMELDPPVAEINSSIATTSSGNTNTSSLPNDIEENKSCTAKETEVGVHVTNPQTSLLTVDCIICNQTVVVHAEQQREDPVGLVILVQGTNVLAHRRHISSTASSISQSNMGNSGTDPNQLHQKQIERATNSNYDGLNFMDEDELNINRYWPALPPLQSQHQQSTSEIDTSDLQQHQSMVPTVVDDDDTTTYASHSDRRKHLLLQYFNNLDKGDLEIGALTTITSAVPIGGSAHVQTCGHHLHLRCWGSYLSSLRGTQRFNADKGEYSCPLCRQLANSLMPLIPPTGDLQQQQQRVFTSDPLNKSTVLTDALNQLTEIIKQQEFELMNPTPPSSYVSGGDSSSSVTSSNQVAIVKFTNSLHEHIQFRFSTDRSQVIQDHIRFPPHREESRFGVEFECGEDSLLDAVNRCVSDMVTTTVITSAANTLLSASNLISAAQRDKLYKVRWHSVISVAWTNIQVELVQRNNTLLTQQKEVWSLCNGNSCYRYQRCTGTASDKSGSNNYYNMLPKRNCIAPLLNVLRVSAQSLMLKYHTTNYNTISDVWCKLVGAERPQAQYKMTHPPLLMRDPSIVLLELVLLLPNLDQDLFDALVKLTYNMQVYVSALKVAISWKQNSNFNRNHNDRYKPSKMKSKNEETGCSGDPMDIDDSKIDIPQILPSVDMSESEDTQDTPLLSSSRAPTFLQAVALAKNMVFFSQDDGNVVDVDVDGMTNDDDELKMHHEDNAITDDILDAPTVDSEDEKQNMLVLESYGRQCTLPFLRFATLLKKYVYEDGEDSLDDNQDLSTLSSPQQGDLNVEHDKQTELLMNPSCANQRPLIKNSPHCHQWSRDDYEYLTLGCYLKLINYDEDAYEDCDSCEDVDNSNSCKNNKGHSPNNVDIKHCIPFQPPSIMEAVIWPQWSYSTPDMTDNISTIISRAWLTSFRLALSPRIPRATIICENTNVSPAALEIDPNSNANIMMAARLLLAVDCCDGGIYDYIRNTNENNDSTSDRGLCLLPTIKWTGPRLLKLPHCYDDVFQYYHARPCHRCHGIPRETSLCLICGTVVCLKENCCKTNGIFEAVQHSLECGGGTGMFLVVTSSSIVVIRGKRACLWGSVYLDTFGEEDRELKRGKPLYLSAERYKLLERQWLAHRFDHTNKKWVWHRDAL